MSTICTICLQYARNKEEVQLRGIDQEEIEMAEEIQEYEVEEMEIVRETEEVEANITDILQIVPSLVNKIVDATRKVEI